MPTLVDNRKAFFDYEIIETFEAGVELLGFEVKALKGGRGSLAGARVLIRGGEAFMISTDIPPYQAKNTPTDYIPDRPRRLLLTGKEIATLGGIEARKGFSLIPLEIYTKSNRIKVKVAVVRGKKKFDKRDSIKRREDDRRTERIMKRADE